MELSMEQKRELLLNAFRSLPPDCEEIAQFRAGYEYRRQFDWLGESGKTISGDGLRYAIETVIISSPVGYGPADQPLVPIPSDPQFHTDFVQAASHMLQDGTQTRIIIFFRYCEREGLEVNNPLVIQEQVRRYLSNYYERAQSGTSPDPW